jgi:beta-lactamase superfamily II metal-dependent hydrolase
MAFEIDYLAVGEGEKAGDCIALRFGDLSSLDNQKVVVIDGGFIDTGEELIKHVNTHYKTNKVDLVISSHADGDHSSGLTIVLEKMNIGALVMHQPWNYAEEIKDKFKHPRITSGGIESKLEASLRHVSELEDIATRKKIPIYEPFSGLKAFDGKMQVLGPDLEYYKELIPQFRGTPEPAKSLGLLGMIRDAGTEAVKWIQDHMNLNLLTDEDTTSPENNSSTIILFNLDGKKILFTGDAGITALTKAISYAQKNNISLKDLTIFHVPHHGSKRNLGRAVMENIMASHAYISAPKNSDKHPAKKITNHLQKKGMKVYATMGMGFCHADGTSGRSGWEPLTPIQFFDKVED